DRRRHASRPNAAVEFGHGVKERTLVLRDAVQKKDDRILHAWIEAWRQINVHITALAQGRRINAIIALMIVCKIEQLTVNAVANEGQFDGVEDVRARRMRSANEYCERNQQ